MPIVIPSRMIQDRVQTDSSNWNSCGNCGSYFFADISEPARPGGIFRACFRNKHRTVISFVDFLQDVPERTIFRCSAPYGFTIVPPLVAIVIVHANDAQAAFIAAEIRMGAAGQHVPSLKHGGAILFRLNYVVGTGGVADNMNHRLRGNELNSLELASQCVRGLNRAADELAFQFVPAPSRERIYVSRVTACPGEEGYFVYRYNERNVEVSRRKSPANPAANSAKDFTQSGSKIFK